MADEEAPRMQWESREPLAPGQEEPETAAFVKSPGKAFVTYPNGDTFEGTFNDQQQKHGFGVYTWSLEMNEEAGAPNNAWVPLNEEGDGPALKEGLVVRFEGEYADGKKHGVGKMTYPSGDVYHGHWQADQPHGEGTYYYANGDIYSGQWAGGKKNGRGALVFKGDDSQLIGLWKDGAIDTGKWVLKDGTSWHGSFRRNKPFGRGVYYFPNGLMQEGEYVAKKLDDEEEEEEEEGAEPDLLWVGKPAVKGTADARDLLAPLPAGQNGESASAAASAAASGHEESKDE